jgi:hypothetical protein
LGGDKVIGSGVFADEGEIFELETLAETARNTPVIMLSGTDPFGHEPDFASKAWGRVTKKTHEFALAHGLEEFEGYYGCDLSTGEFIKP